jgi:uncharacterized protein
MQPSQFNVHVPLPERNEVFIMNTFSDAQVLASPDITELLDRLGRGETAFSVEDQETLESLVENGFVVESREQEQRHIDQYFRDVREDTERLKVTVLTTLQCNFACDYCFQGDHGDYNKFAAKMSLDTAERVVGWIEQRLDEVKPEKFTLTLFGGEPLLNLPAAYLLAERCWQLCEARGVEQTVSVITNGLLLTPEVVDRLLPFGLAGVKVTLDGDRDTHNRMRPLRGRQGTFDRIVENVRRIAGKVPITIGGNFDESSWDSYPALIEWLAQQDFAPHIKKINFKPIIKSPVPEAPPAFAEATAGKKGIIPLTVVGSNNKPLGGTCMTSAGAGGGQKSSGPCDSCHFVDEKMSFLREETRNAGFYTLDGVHMGPCEIHRRHAYTIGPEGSLYACPGFTGVESESTGHIDGREDTWRMSAAERFEHLSPKKEECGDCSYVPVCGGGCSMAAHSEIGDMNQPSCHKGSFESAMVVMARHAVSSLVHATSQPVASAN